MFQTTNQKSCLGWFAQVLVAKLTGQPESATTKNSRFTRHEVPDEISGLHGVFQATGGRHNGQRSQAHGLHLHQAARLPPGNSRIFGNFSWKSWKIPRTMSNPSPVHTKHPHSTKPWCRSFPHSIGTTIRGVFSMNGGWDSSRIHMGVSNSSWGYPKNGWFLWTGQSHRLKWMMTGGTPISGNHHMF